MVSVFAGFSVAEPALSAQIAATAAFPASESGAGRTARCGRRDHRRHHPHTGWRRLSRRSGAGACQSRKTPLRTVAAGDRAPSQGTRSGSRGINTGQERKAGPMGIVSLARRFVSLPPTDRRYYLQRFLDLKVHARSGFSQFGEDASIAAYLRTLGRTCRFYVDIGANRPVLHSNTYLFYRDGASGVLVEANPLLTARLRKKRPRDRVVNRGVLAEGSGTIDLHVMDMDGLSTLSSEWEERIVSRGLARSEQVVQVAVIGINDLLEAEVGTKAIDLASIDIEGLDFDVLSAWNFDRWRPFLFCVETGQVDPERYGKDRRFHDLLGSSGYEPLFETFANTIFVDRLAKPA
ncbi:FkbM family methyltransferase [Sphingosinicella sp. BN140058]|uniref:FkbM family methyltransferase n=1 Tax=Sphingosinicella sp. BN140058 TaxID=1892855 RepID=UPI0013EC51AC|nr:FkbM family methyltransferase [Sphingosinicella sp. BN140058]